MSRGRWSTTSERQRAARLVPRPPLGPLGERPVLGLGERVGEGHERLGERGAGDTRTPMLVALIGPMVIRLSACWLLAFELEMGLLGIWVATTIDWAIRAIVLAIVFRAGRWKSIEV